MLKFNLNLSTKESLHCASCHERLQKRHARQRADLDERARTGTLGAEQIAREFKQQVDCEGGDLMGFHNEWPVKVIAGLYFDGEAQTLKVSFWSKCSRCGAGAEVEQTLPAGRPK